MALTCSVSVSVLSFCLLLLVFVWTPLHANASKEITFGRRYSISEQASTSGVCATAVAVHGYKCQEFEVKTKDGFILSLQRIPHGRIKNEGESKPPVILQHGVLVDGISWLINPPEYDLPFILADNGFDVWIANTRGTQFSRRHVSLDANDPKYWDWSWDDLAAYDLPALFDFVHKKTGQKSHYVGHSLGTLTCLTALSEGRLVDQMKSAALLSPVAYLSHITTRLGVIAANFFIGEKSKLIGLAEFVPRGDEVSELLNRVCDFPGVECYDLVSSVTGLNCCLNSTTENIFLENAPQSTSVKNVIHLSQMVREGKLAKYDYVRLDENMKHYGDVKPPLYNLSNIPHDIPLFIGAGAQDALSDVQDVQLLLDDLKSHNPDKLSVHQIKEYAHADFILAVNAKDIVYKPVMDFFRKYK